MGNFSLKNNPLLKRINLIEDVSKIQYKLVLNAQLNFILAIVRSPTVSIRLKVIKVLKIFRLKDWSLLNNISCSCCKFSLYHLLVNMADSRNGTSLSIL